MIGVVFVMVIIAFLVLLEFSLRINFFNINILFFFCRFVVLLLFLCLFRLIKELYRIFRVIFLESMILVFKI